MKMIVCSKILAREKKIVYFYMKHNYLLIDVERFIEWGKRVQYV